jgi:hypothetical protein
MNRKMKNRVTKNLKKITIPPKISKNQTNLNINFWDFFKYMENSKKIKNGLNEGISQFQPEFSYQRYESFVP